MSKKSVIIELKASPQLATMTLEGHSLDVSGLPKLKGVTYDQNFPCTEIPNISELDPDDQQTDFFVDQTPSYIVCAEVEEKEIESITKKKEILGVFANVEIEPIITCGPPAVGTDKTVERLLNTTQMRKCGMDGNGVVVAIVDTGVNMRHLYAKGKSPSFDAARSWTPNPGTTPGSAPIGHGTMCAFDVCIAAPKCTLLDIALLRTTRPGLRGVLADAIRAYRHLITIKRRAPQMSLVVNNSWGMFHPSWDFPVGHPGNYSHNSNHPFNRIVATLERLGTDILFAAGNCGPECPDRRCRNVTDKGIYGANSHPKVLSVAGVDTNRRRVGYSNLGPGNLDRNKPDICGYTHFKGSGVYPYDGGTSAACPVVAGVVAAIRSKRPYNSGSIATYPAAIRNLVRATADDVSPSGFDFKTGYGIINGRALIGKLCKPSICDRYPWLCPPRRNICRIYPQLCYPYICRIRPDLCRPRPWPWSPSTPPGKPQIAPPRVGQRTLHFDAYQETDPGAFQDVFFEDQWTDEDQWANEDSQDNPELDSYWAGYHAALAQLEQSYFQEQFSEFHSPQSKKDCGCSCK